MDNKVEYRAGNALLTPSGEKVTLTLLRQLLKKADVTTVAERLGFAGSEAINDALYNRWRFKTMPTNSKTISAEEELWLRTIYQFNKVKQYAPTELEVAEVRQCDLFRTMLILQHLKDKGLVDWIEDEHRTLHVTPRGHKSALNHKRPEQVRLST